MKIEKIISVLENGKTLQKHYDIPIENDVFEYISIGIVLKSNSFIVRKNSFKDGGNEFFLETGFVTIDKEFSNIYDAIDYIRDMGFDIHDFGYAKGSKVI